MGTSFENRISVSFWAFLENNANIFYLKTGFPLFFWLVMGTSFENGISVFFWAFLENNANIFYLKTGFPFFRACDGNKWKIIPISSILKRNFRVFSGLVMGTLKTGFPLFFLACDGNLWKIMPISSIWKRNFRVFSGLVMGTSFENGISVSFWAFLENNANIFYLKTGFPFFWACDGNLWKIMPISSIWKRNFRVFSGLVMGTSFENGISVSFWAFLENNANILYLKTGFPFFWACDGNLWKIMPISSIWKRDFLFFGLVMATSGK